MINIDIEELKEYGNNINNEYQIIINILKEYNNLLADSEIILNTPKTRNTIIYFKEYISNQIKYLESRSDNINNKINNIIELYSNLILNGKDYNE